VTDSRVLISRRNEELSLDRSRIAYVIDAPANGLHDVFLVLDGPQARALAPSGAFGGRIATTRFDPSYRRLPTRRPSGNSWLARGRSERPLRRARPEVEEHLARKWAITPQFTPLSRFALSLGEGKSNRGWAGVRANLEGTCAIGDFRDQLFEACLANHLCGRHSMPQSVLPSVAGVIGIGTVIQGKYRLVRALGDGGMGAVFEGEHVVLGTLVAVKFSILRW